MQQGSASSQKKNRKHVQLINDGVTQEELVSFLENPAWGNNQIREKINLYTRRNNP